MRFAERSESGAGTPAPPSPPGGWWPLVGVIAAGLGVVVGLAAVGVLLASVLVVSPNGVLVGVGEVLALDVRFVGPHVVRPTRGVWRLIAAVRT